MATKKEAAKAILADYNNYENRKVTLNTLYKKCFFDRSRGTFRVIGKAHDYSY